MFGKRSSSGAERDVRRQANPALSAETDLKQPAKPAEAAAPAAQREAAEPAKPAKPAKPAAPAPASAPAPEPSRSPSRPDNYYDIKTEVFAALMSAMDMTRIAADGNATRPSSGNHGDRHRHHRREATSSSLDSASRPLLVARNLRRCSGLRPFGDFAGARRHRRHHGQRRRHTVLHRDPAARWSRPASAFRDNAQLLEICQRMVSQGRPPGRRSQPDL